MPFVHYNSIYNHKNQKSIKNFIEDNPRYTEAKFVAQHKYDGSNFQIIFEIDRDLNQNEVNVSFGSRNFKLESDENFNNHRELVKKETIARMINNIKDFLLKSNKIKSINLFGEIYGKVIRRINYYAPGEKEENKLVFFDVLFDSNYQSCRFFSEWAQEMSVPVVETFFKGSLDECLALRVEEYKSAGGDVIEGIVIKPFDHVLDRLDHFYVKKKLEGFEEIVVPKKNQSTPYETQLKKKKFSNLNCSDEKKTHLQLFENYLNSNRVKSVLSKKAWTKQDTKQIANELLIDALKDFNIDNETLDLDLPLITKAFNAQAFALIKQEDLFK